MSRLLSLAERSLRYAVASLVGAIVVLVTLQVLFRYALEAPLVWSEELTTLSYQWVSYLGAALAVRHRGHYGIDLMVRSLSSAWRGRLRWIEHAVITMLGLFMVIFGASLAVSTAGQSYPTLGFSVGLGYLVLPVSGALFLLMELAVLLDRGGAAP